MGQLWTVTSHLHSIAGPTIMLLYPLYASVCAIESPSKVDDEQWLAYWIIYSFLTLFEMLAQPVLYWIPLWYPLKIMVVSWLVLPQFRGAAFIYERFVKEQLQKYREQAGKSRHEAGKNKQRQDKFVTFVTPNKGEREIY